MTELFTRAKTLPAAYHAALSGLSRKGDIVDCPDWNTRCMEAGLTLVVDNPLREPMISRLMPATPYDLQKYKMEMLDGIMDFCVGKGWDYTYHLRMTRFPCRDENGDDWEENQIDFVIDELSSDPYSRRAIINVRDVYADSYMGDPACLQHIQFLIRDGKLNMDVLFRSNDAVNAAFMNDFALVMLQQRIAARLSVDVGCYVKRVNSFHAYERDWEKLRAWDERIGWDTDGLTYEYEGDWKKLMQAEEAKINRFVEELHGE